MLSEIISKLSKEEVRMFKLIISRVDTRGGRKTEELFDEIRACAKSGKEVDQGALAEKIYGEDTAKTRNKIYALRNRLTRELNRSLSFQHFELDAQQRVMQQFLMGRVLRKKGSKKTARTVFTKALKEARKQDLFFLQEMIYEELLALSGDDLSINVGELIEARESNDEPLQFLKEMQNAIAFLNHQLRRSNFSQKGEDIMSIMHRVRDRSNQFKSFFQSPKGRIRIFNITSQMLLQAGSFDQLEVYLKNEFQEFEENGFFDKNTHRTKIIMLIWLINATFKNYRFEESSEYCKLLKGALEDYNRRYYAQFILSYYLGLVNNFTCMGQSERALNLLNSVVRNEKELAETDLGIYIYLNLANVHYELNDHKAALQTLSKAYTLSSFSNLNRQNQLLVYVFELALRFEEGDYEFGVRRIAKVRRWYAEGLKEWEDQAAFLDILEVMYEEAMLGKVDWERPAIQTFMASGKGFFPGENEMIDYRIWLKSQREKERYPKLLLEVINEQRATSTAAENRR